MERQLQILLPEIKEVQNYGRVYPKKERKRYIDMAKECPPQSYNPWKEAKRILENLKHNVMSIFVSIPCQIPANCMSISCMCNIVFRMLYSFVLSYNMQCIWAQDHDMELCFILVGKREPYVGVTDKGKAFLQDNNHIPLSFVSSIQSS